MNTSTYKIKLEEEKKILEDELASMGKLDKETGDWEATPPAQSAPEADESDASGGNREPEKTD